MRTRIGKHDSGIWPVLGINEALFGKAPQNVQMCTCGLMFGFFVGRQYYCIISWNVPNNGPAIWKQKPFVEYGESLKDVLTISHKQLSNPVGFAGLRADLQMPSCPVMHPPSAFSWSQFKENWQVGKSLALTHAANVMWFLDILCVYFHSVMLQHALCPVPVLFFASLDCGETIVTELSDKIFEIRDMVSISNRAIQTNGQNELIKVFLQPSQLYQ